jgi:hypothetical protein
VTWPELSRRRGISYDPSQTGVRAGSRSARDPHANGEPPTPSTKARLALRLIPRLGVFGGKEMKMVNHPRPSPDERVAARLTLKLEFATLAVRLQSWADELKALDPVPLERVDLLQRSAAAVLLMTEELFGRVDA